MIWKMFSRIVCSIGQGAFRWVCAVDGGEISIQHSLLYQRIFFPSVSMDRRWTEDVIEPFVNSRKYIISRYERSTSKLFSSFPWKELSSLNCSITMTAKQGKLMTENFSLLIYLTFDLSTWANIKLLDRKYFRCCVSYGTIQISFNTIWQNDKRFDRLKNWSH